MKLKYVLFIFILFILLCGGVYASDVNDTELSYASDEVVENTGNDVNHSLGEDVLKQEESSLPTLQSDDNWRYQYDYVNQLVWNASAGDTIVLKKGEYNFAVGDASPGIFINKPITIDGNGSRFSSIDKIFLIKAPIPFGA